ncbi:hypothetical protein DYB28_004312 [Aphanomyces astaci]|uniref:Uncharacterized protein n=1 Tax=Aphanomyces astaci TaxID=112090 RepID=A0A397CS90_APHAT|nr:hypothetical protein DYB25_012168 [Aphanomyces astaci]RHY40382.1 hypothetical protein DYB34_012150 [Aphanomyces astaci]RHY42123.1 hypothetical protein DYB30_012817 [Aphanomyces astaci]RHY51365.1 hypothetical protein DYB38_012071 [Aphanomyces astaci]RHZ11249.1 hypothetical protein DYB26_011888 [Aphanomyces astaci]
MTGSMALMSFWTLCLVADATEAYSYEAISTRVFSPLQVWVLRILTVLPCFGSMLMNMLVAVDLLLPFQALFSRTMLCLVFALVTFPMCLPDTLHALRMTNTMVRISLGMVTWIAIRTSDLGTAMTWVGTFDGVMFHFVVPGLFLASTPSSQFATRLPRCATEMGWGVVCIGLAVAVASLSRLVEQTTNVS